MLGLSRYTIERIENGTTKESAESIATYEDFIRRWDNVPEIREMVEAEARRTALRYRAAALARRDSRRRDNVAVTRDDDYAVASDHD
jgi:transcriptional regulator with XRE-family HTH domain